MEEVNFEHIMLKNLIENSEYFGKLSPHLNRKYFKNIANQNIYGLMEEYYGQFQAIPSFQDVIISVRDIPNQELRSVIAKELKQIKDAEVVTNFKFLIDKSVDFIKDSIFTEGLMIGAEGITKKNDENKLKAWNLIEQAFKISIDTDIGLSFDDIEKRIEYYNNALSGILTSHETFNKRLGSGFLPKTLSVVAAPQGIGKSLLLADITSDVLKQGKNVLFVSMEMSDYETFKRIDANVLDLPINEFKGMDKNLIRERFNSIKETTGKLYIKEYAPGSFSSIQLNSLLDNYKNEHNIEFDLVLLDYLGIMKSDRYNPSVGPYLYVKAISEEVRAVAVTRQMPIVTAAQLNRSASNNLESGNDAMADSMGVVMTADFIVMLLQNDDMKSAKRIKFKVTKNRFTGLTDSWDMGIDYTRMRFLDLLDSESGLTQSYNPPKSQESAQFNTTVSDFEEFDF